MSANVAAQPGVNAKPRLLVHGFGVEQGDDRREDTWVVFAARPEVRAQDLGPHGVVVALGNFVEHSRHEVT